MLHKAARLLRKLQSCQGIFGSDTSFTYCFFIDWSSTKSSIQSKLYEAV